MKQRARLVVLVLVATGAVAALMFRDRFAPDALTTWVAAFGLAAPAVFCIARVLAAVVLVPGSVMGIAAGAAFGVMPGAVYNLISSTAGAIAAFAIARFIAPDWFHTRFRDRQLADRLIRGVEAEGWRFVAFIRLVPLFPYNVVNYALGLTRIGMAEYSLTTLVCMIPGDLAYVYLGYAARETLAGNERAWQLGLAALGALAALAFLPRIARRLRTRSG